MSHRSLIQADYSAFALVEKPFLLSQSPLLFLAGNDDLKTKKKGNLKTRKNCRTTETSSIKVNPTLVKLSLRQSAENLDIN